ncbi:hypothetical protein [Sphingobacterium paludis]|uniref:Uncharacterized protein n=1 Tax=Sphingobacterium paludis TaxID=1476465 RepID=A0A4R7D701_9SPHI|nr:hypothetical protein [Sphingobacterium paludis]TDS14756.1 hypothetical protein B0I21_103255 [Sphingobacterium paludis]
MDNTVENRLKFFAIYWGQRVCLAVYPHEGEHIDKVGQWNIHHVSHLRLKPISGITAEDACYIAMLLVQRPDSMSKLTEGNVKVRGRIDGDHAWDELVMEFGGSFNYTVRYRGGDFLVWIDKGRSEWNSNNHLEVYDYLRSKGYALPAYGLSVDELVKRGWIVLEGGPQ